ncbi:hypothetical protein O3M35_001094 [Rhynocoris fuscipes]|uniref:CHK kinase-like domain-containing protein n=1 Tax=Rhynocoris fuscipes TaxID=488301 RepID=A0AAW1DTU7_9HEMI
MVLSTNAEMEKSMLEALIKKKLNDQCISRIVTMAGKQPLSKGENYCSVITFYRLETVLGSGEKCIRNLIMKVLPPSPEQSKFFQEYSFFKNEIIMYSQVLNAMNKLMEEHEDRREKLWCEMITYNPYDMVIFEDLRDKDYKMLNRKENLGFEHSMLVMQTLGRFHAMSKVLLTRGSIYKNDLSTYLFTAPLIINLCFKSSLMVFETVVKKSWGEKWKHLPAILQRAKDRVYDILTDLKQVDEKRFNVLCHGDCWTNNMLFKHVEGTETPCAVKYIDYQLSHYNSYAWDLTYFLYNATRPDIRRAKFQDFLKVYQSSLEYNLKYFNYKNDDIPTLKQIEDEMKRIKLFGFLLLISIHTMTTADSTDAFDMEKALSNPDNPSIGINADIYNEKFKKRIEDDVRTFIEEGIISKDM